MSTQKFTDVDQLSLGFLYELNQENDWRSRVPWFAESGHTMAVDRPKDGTYVVYLGKHPSASEGIFYYSLLSSDGKKYRVYNTDFVYGLRETQHEVL